MNENTNKPKRPYKKITARTVAMHTAQRIIDGNGTKAVRTVDPEYVRPDDRAYRIQAKADDINAVDYIDNRIEQIGSDAIDRVGELVNSSDERIATKNAHFVVDHLRGKAMQKKVSVTAKLNIQSVLD